jgi:hypothetical protein
MGSVSRAIDVDTQRQISARHEAGHVVGAAVVGLPLRGPGMAVDEDGEGISYFWKRPEDSDSMREAVIVAIYAGIAADRRFRVLNSYPVLDELHLIHSLDWKELGPLEGRLTDEYLRGRGVGFVDRLLQARADELVLANWTAIEGIVTELLAREWEPVGPLQETDQWSKAARAQHLSGEMLIQVLGRFGIAASCTEQPSLTSQR